MSRPDRGLNSGGMLGWFMQRITGILLIPVVLAHLLVTHYVFANPMNGAFDVDYARVAERLANPWWKLIDIVFLGIVLFHGLRGVLVVLNEGVRTPWLRVTLYCAVLALGAALAILGTVTILPFQATAAAR